MTDLEFEHQFAAGELSPALFTHEAHLRLAWIHVTQYGVETAVKNVTRQIKSYTQKLNAADKYNHTLTVAAIKAVYHFVLKAKSDNFQDFLKEFPRLKFNFKELMAYHYGFDIYTSPKAKKTFLEPDLLPFD
ncbi:hypothetical protein [Flagellimonas allohymeniacidonis]|uniref:Uncharacterized protein n=1 Tax=Flagellimonas allohymeniacidonis TaxID=2517819 RepID=A0A4Q8QCS8_9FLAO|nr:hypothetical protein [Allomuricauda hymeniacidonis]TAI47267.1 hypothetical protein EW142_11330 [Allomuricauda hymeniacidonis]